VKVKGWGVGTKRYYRMRPRVGKGGERPRETHFGPSRTVEGTQEWSHDSDEGKNFKNASVEFHLAWKMRRKDGGVEDKPR